ncbi:MAG: M3 family oligoendopeptidase [Anaerolineales bacterium]
MDNKKTLKREAVATESTWDRDSVYPSWEEWQQDFEKTMAGLSDLTEFSGQLGKGPQVLLNWFETFSKYYYQVYKLFAFTNMAINVDAGDEEAKGHNSQINSLFAKFLANTAFANPELQEIGDELFNWVTEEPRLAEYQHFIDNQLRLKPHQRSAEVEEILGMMESPLTFVYQTFNELTNTDLTFADAVDSLGDTYPVQQATVPPVGIQSPDREHRRTAWESFADAHLGMQNTLASNYLAMINYYYVEANIRGYDSVLEMMLSPSNLPVSVFHNLIQTFKNNLHIFHRYWEVKRKILQIDQMHPYDVQAPIVKRPPEIPFQQAVNLLCAAMAPLGSEYVGIIHRACLEDRWVDYAPNEGKSQGAMSGLAIGDLPPFIFMSYKDDIKSFSVLVHELGHALQHNYQNQHQPVIYTDYRFLSSAIAETASNFHQAMTRAYLQEFKKEDLDFQTAVLDEAMFNLHRYLFVMPTLSRFELEVFERLDRGEPLNARALNSIMAELFAEGYGSTLDDDHERTAITWAQFSHLYFPFYTFQYAIGVSAALALADGVLSGLPGAAGNYLEFLKKGASMYPIDLWNLAGVDMSTLEPVEKAFTAVSNIVDQLESLAT